VKIPVIIVLCATVFSTLAQAPSTNSAPRRNFTPPVISPQIAEDKSVTFRLRAPRASEVTVQGQWKNGRLPMSKGSNDVWSVTSGPIEPGVWEYSFNLDGVTIIDPGSNQIKPMREPRTSILHIVGDPPKIWDFQDVPHGTVSFHTYRSKPVGRIRQLAVYTPPGYNKNSRDYPLLVLQHGSGDNQATWTVHGKAHWILDNLIAQKKAEPMVVLMMDGHASAPGSGGGGGFNNNTELFERDLLEEALPFVDQNYRVKKGAKNRGIVGLSMGGGQSLTIGLKHTDKFAWVGGFSSAVPNKEIVEKNAEGAKKLKLLWVGCGKDDFLLQRNNEFIALLKSKEINHEWRLTEGNHSWPVWRDYLAEFAPKLFH
jgi:enterochelin esterase-like enzyme